MVRERRGVGGAIPNPPNSTGGGGGAQPTGGPPRGNGKGGRGGGRVGGGGGRRGSAPGEGLGADTLSGCAGDDVYDMGSAPAGADIITETCTASSEGNDTLDYSARVGNLNVNLSHTLSATLPSSDTGGLSGEASGDGAHIS